MQGENLSKWSSRNETDSANGRDERDKKGRIAEFVLDSSGTLEVMFFAD